MSQATVKVSPVFRVQLLSFEGTLGELASALRRGTIQPGELSLLNLTQEVLAWVRAQLGGLFFTEAHPELLPTLAQVIALKTRLLLPRPVQAQAPGEEEGAAPDSLRELLGEVEVLAELETLVAFLAQRRRDREGLLPARPVALDWPRRERVQPPQTRLAKLLRAAQQAVRQIETPLLSCERLSLSEALRHLKRLASRLKRFAFRTIPAQGWGERTTYFAALLEGIKEGWWQAEQADLHGEIQVQLSQGR